MQSVYKIRSYLRNESNIYVTGTKLGKIIREMRTTCRRFCHDVKDAGGQPVATDHPLFLHSLQEFKTAFGNHIKIISDSYGLDVPGSLHSLISAATE